MIETNRVEFKRELNSKIEKEVVGFLNNPKGGTIYIGIDDSVNVGNNIKLSKSQKNMLYEISTNNKITQEEIIELIKVSDRTVQRNTLILQEKGLLKRVGPTNGGHWEVIK